MKSPHHPRAPRSLRGGRGARARHLLRAHASRDAPTRPQSNLHAGRRRLAFLLSALLLVVPSAATLAGEKKPKKAIKESDARKVIAATPGFGLNTGAVRVREVSLAGTTPVVVNAEVEIAFGFEKVEAGPGQAGGGVARWRAVEFRTGDRAWDEFDYLAGPLGAERVEGARALLEELAAEFEAEQRVRRESEEAARKADGARDEDAGRGDVVKDGRGRGVKKGDEQTKAEKEKGEKSEDGKKAEDAKKAEDEKKAEDAKKVEVRKGPLLMKEFTPMYKSARAVVAVDASFRLEKDARGKWRVVGFSVGGASFDDFERLTAAVDERKAARARADLEAVRAALEVFRRERGFYVVAEDEAVLIDHLSPQYLKTVIRIDPWHRPYRYAGTRERFTLASDGPDGKPSTADDVTLAGGA